MSAARGRNLQTLFKRMPAFAASTLPDVRIRGVSMDSRTVRPGWMFAAIQGENANGYDYIPQALANGAAAVMGTLPAPAGLNAPYLQIAGDIHQAVAYLAAALHDFPARKLRMLGVTGTDGKTTTTSMVYHILRSAGIRAGMISTVSAQIGEHVLDTGFHVTTPEAPDIQGYLAEMVRAGLSHCVLETTSHGLAQGRVAACDFDAAVITNVTHEHLDYHGSYENYLRAKGMLFESLSQTPRKRSGNLRAAVLNKDDQSYAYLKRVSPARQVSYSMLNEADLWADEIDNQPTELAFTCHFGEGKALRVRTPMTGLYNVSNSLAALGLCVNLLGVPAETAVQALASLPGVPGRMERIDLGQPFNAIVDFAHTPNALSRALETARGFTQGRLIAVFGSAGLRDREKRKMMPAVSIQQADLTYLTAEDPRTESLDAILQDMADSAVEAGGREGETFWRVPDRGEAIRAALQAARPGDLVIVCGKGHEQSMCFGKTEYAWDDRQAVRSALAELLGVPGPAMPWLPTSKERPGA
ncbi:MAG TPA: UDP-N-acetylmuramoyl-L-alanyl-D-glutamate--2,6-diaminopimelate ligase [Anaerolineaceae bacterium]|nr:UDP-N-acetylmuramoyl-L-alanyl-D-glutamate--2,6-diaminopimelate ligase [Anaerolineaceae bacterium]